MSISINLFVNTNAWIVDDDSLKVVFQKVHILDLPLFGKFFSGEVLFVERLESSNMRFAQLAPCSYSLTLLGDS